MQSKIQVGAGVAAVLSLITCASSARSGAVVFDSLGGATSSSAFGGGIEPAVAATFKMGRSSEHVDVSLLLRDSFPEGSEPSDTYTVSLNGGIPLSDLSFDPIGGLNYVNGAPVDPQGSVIKSVTLPLSGLPTTWTLERYDQFEDVELKPNSLYWIELDVTNQSEVGWGLTADLSGLNVANNYLAWSLTDDGFFLNKGVDPFPFDGALQMEVDAVPESSTWAMMALGFASLGFLGWRGPRKNAERAA
jgi:hypothetical protein